MARWCWSLRKRKWLHNTVMSIPRLIGYLGIALLVPVGVLGLVTAFSRQDWHGFLLMAGFVGLLVFFAYSLRSAAQRESSPALKAGSNLGWYGEPLSALFRGPILHTPEGLIMLVGSLTSVLFAFLSFFLPSWIGLSSNRSEINATVFGIWPIVLFVFYIKFCAPDFKPRVYSSLLVLCSAGLPFYMAFK